MKKLSRAKNTMRNTLWGAIYRVATLIGPFAIKTIIIKELGQERPVHPVHLRADGAESGQSGL